MSPSPRRAQVAIESLFVLAIVLTGVAVVVGPYLSSSEAVSADVYVKNAASDACAYLNMGVLLSDSLHQPLNEILQLSNYSPGTFMVEGISSEGEKTLTVTVVMSHKGSLQFWYGNGKSQEDLENAFKEYILRYITTSNPHIPREGDELVFGETRVKINVYVRG
ncbi:hypothetical protein [Thermococcus stetteri]|uniref:hypothetical protein n=1 Tax=Thermococcus stetteri TaxID=49900 RepID=UPI001AE97058|nr:hypothetical protein [Thermococcus stetteri]MBP1911752.1 hypothetical protein [Thermococcus stetteri]